MYDLPAFRERVAALYRRATPYDGRRPTQQDLAEAVGLSRSELSRRLNGLQNARLTSRDVHAIVQTLAAWGAITTQVEALELLAQADCPSFSVAQWQSPPLDELTPAAPPLPAPPVLTSKSLTNLPHPITSFIGREQEVSEISRLISQRRLVTLAGAGGCGKTRLALETTSRLLTSFHDGVYLVELASLSDPTLLPLTVATTLGVQEQPDQPVSEALRRYLQPREMLLVLDNCEHLIAAVAQFVAELLAASPRLHILVTSREALHLGGEAIRRVLPLTLPQREDDSTPERLSQFEAVQLFVARATSIRPSFHLTAENAATVRRICEQLDGIPLALELAAARLQVLSVAQLADQLSARFRLLADRRRDVDPRHQTLRALLQWSYDLLPPDEQALFRHLAVFSGGFTLEAVTAVMDAATIDLLDTLNELLNKSLILIVTPSLREGEGGGAESATRLTMLETIREYALLRLREAGEEEAARQAHATYFREWASQLETQRGSGLRAGELTQLEREYYNLSAAVNWSLEDEPQALTALQISGELWRFWQASGRLSEGRRYLEAALTRADAADIAIRAAALMSAGRFAFFQSDLAAAQQRYEQSLALQRELGDERGIGRTINNLAAVHLELGDYPIAHRYAAGVLAIRRKLGNKEEVATSLNNLGVIVENEGDYRHARSLYQQALALRRELGDKKGVAESQGNLALVAFSQGDYTKALANHQAVLVMWRELGDKWNIAYALDNLANVLIAQGNHTQVGSLLEESLHIYQEMENPDGIVIFLESMARLTAAQQRAERAVCLWAAADTMRQALKSPMHRPHRLRYERSIAALRTTLGNAAFARAWVAGQMMSQEQAVAYALEDDHTTQLVPDVYA